MMGSVTSPAAEPPQPRVGVSIAIAVVCFGIGVAAVVISAGQPATDKPPAARVHASHARAPAATSTQRATHTPTTALLHADSPPDATPVVTDAAERKPPTPPARIDTPRDGAMSVIPGRVAYLRCDGLTGERGRFPCPRDVDVERAVWETLAALPTCTPGLGRGTADVRLDLSRGQGTEARVLAIPGSPEPSLDTQRVYGCVGKRLTALTTRLDPIYMVISFRFALR